MSVPPCPVLVNIKIAVEALKKAGRNDLIGNGPNCLIKGESNNYTNNNHNTKRGNKNEPKKKYR